MKACPNPECTDSTPLIRQVNLCFWVECHCGTETHSARTREESEFLWDMIPRRTDIDALLAALEGMARQHCHLDPITCLVTSEGIPTNAAALTLLAQYGRFTITNRMDKRVLGFWPKQIEGNQ